MAKQADERRDKVTTVTVRMESHCRARASKQSHGFSYSFEKKLGGRRKQRVEWRRPPAASACLDKKLRPVSVGEETGQ